MHSLERIALLPGRNCARCPVENTQHQIGFRCACGSVCVGKFDHVWIVTRNGDGTANLSPSVDFQKHFHAYYSAVPVARYLRDLFPELAGV